MYERSRRTEKILYVHSSSTLVSPSSPAELWRTDLCTRPRGRCPAPRHTPLQRPPCGSPHGPHTTPPHSRAGSRSRSRHRPSRRTGTLRWNTRHREGGGRLRCRSQASVPPGGTKGRSPLSPRHASRCTPKRRRPGVYWNQCIGLKLVVAEFVTAMFLSKVPKE